MNEVKIGKYSIGPEFSPFIIGEAGINHNGEIDKAFKMIELAKKSGLDAIKFQTFRASEFIGDATLTHTYFSQGKKITESQLELFTRCELSREEFFKIKEKCAEEKIMFLSTPEDRSDLDLLIEIGVPAIKVGSDELVNLHLLKDFASTGLPIILSTGMSTLEEISNSLKAIGTFSGYPTVLLVTTSQYPTPYKDVNLLKFPTLSKNFPNIPLGFSDHTEGFLASSLACAFGACVFEKHFTLNHDLPGPDHEFSEDPNGLIKWVDAIRKSRIMLGSNEVKPTKLEEQLKISFRRSIVALRDIKQDDLFDEKNIGFKRPGNGLSPSLFEKVLGQKSNKDYKNGEQIQL